jgi:hypothetical protein
MFSEINKGRQKIKTDKRKRKCNENHGRARGEAG